MVTTFYPPHHFGGDGIFVYRLAEALAAQGHLVDVVHSVDAYHLQHPEDPELSFSHHPNVRRHSLESKRPVLAAFAAHQMGRPSGYAGRIRALFRDDPYDVIHYHNVSLVGGPGVLRFGRAVKLYTAHEYWLICPTHVLFAFDRNACTVKRCLACTLHSRRPPQLWRYTGLIHRCARHVDCFLMPSRFAMERHRSDGLDRPMVHLPHFVPPAAPGNFAQTPGTTGRPYFLFVGRLEKMKGVQDLIRLFADYQAADLLVVGAGSYAPALQEQAWGLPHVRFMGQVHPAEMAELYRGAIAVLVPSLCYETFGLTAAEALSYGTPAIVRGIGALPEIISQSGAGYEFQTLTECRDRMDQLRTNAELRSELGRRGLLAAQKLWSMETHVNCYLDLVGSLLQAKQLTECNLSGQHMPTDLGRTVEGTSDKGIGVLSR